MLEPEKMIRLSRDGRQTEKSAPDLHPKRSTMQFNQPRACQIRDRRPLGGFYFDFSFS
jgi:hypothetical protein